jgi:hypothetical protein
MKYSYKGSAMKSSVVILADGRAMEVRRDEKTTFAEGERRIWASWAEWMGTLPDDAEVVESGSTPVKPVVTNPVLVSFIERVAATGRQIGSDTLCYTGTRGEIVGRDRKFAEKKGAIPWATAVEHASGITRLDELIETLIRDGTTHMPVFYPSGAAGYITQTVDGELEEIRFNTTHNAIGYFSGKCSWDFCDPGTNFVPLTDSRMPIWMISQHGAPVWIPVQEVAAEETEETEEAEVAAEEYNVAEVAEEAEEEEEEEAEETKEYNVEEESGITDWALRSHGPTADEEAEIAYMDRAMTDCSGYTKKELRDERLLHKWIQRYIMLRSRMSKVMRDAEKALDAGHLDGVHYALSLLKEV